MKAIEKSISFVWALQPCASRFYGGLRNVHLIPMRHSKICITIYEGRKKSAFPLHERLSNVHHSFMKAVKMRISFLCAFQKLHHGSWRSKKKKAFPFHVRLSNVHRNFMKAVKTSVSPFLWALQKFAPRFTKVIKSAYPLHARLIFSPGLATPKKWSPSSFRTRVAPCCMSPETYFAASVWLFFFF